MSNLDLGPEPSAKRSLKHRDNMMEKMAQRQDAIAVELAEMAQRQDEMAVEQEETAMKQAGMLQRLAEVAVKQARMLQRLDEVAAKQEEMVRNIHEMKGMMEGLYDMVKRITALPVALDEYGADNMDKPRAASEERWQSPEARQIYNIHLQQWQD